MRKAARARSRRSATTEPAAMPAICPVESAAGAGIGVDVWEGGSEEVAEGSVMVCIVVGGGGFGGIELVLVIVECEDDVTDGKSSVVALSSGTDCVVAVGIELLSVGDWDVRFGNVDVLACVAVELGGNGKTIVTVMITVVVAAGATNSVENTVTVVVDVTVARVKRLVVVVTVTLVTTARADITLTVAGCCFTAEL